MLRCACDLHKGERRRQDMWPFNTEATTWLQVHQIFTLEDNDHRMLHDASFGFTNAIETALLKFCDLHGGLRTL